MPSLKMQQVILVTLFATFTLLLSSCGLNMYDQPRAEYQETSAFLPGGVSVQPLPEGVVSRERGGYDKVFYTGLDANGFVTELPIPLTLELLQRGQQRYNIYCTPCHNFSGDGLGVIVQKGMPQPTSFHDQRLRDVQIGYFFNTMTNGFGRMYSYASRIPPEDRWAIAAYIRALQLSQNATLGDVPAELRDTLPTQGASLPTSQGAVQ
jgi:Cytochrome C oxidase, cbb3-type, subunit III